MSSQAGSYKEDYLAPFNEQIMDESHIRDVKTVSGSTQSHIPHIFIPWFQYLTAVADPTGGQDMSIEDLAYREG